MRKDLKIGMAIGAVLLVVLIVYFAMPKPDAGQTELAEAGAPGDGGNDPAAAVDPDASTPEEGIPTDEDEATDAPAGARSGAVAAHGTPPGPADPFDANAQAPDADEADETAPPDGEGTNWAKLLDTGEFAPPLRSVTPAPSGRGGASDTVTGGTPVAGGPSVSGSAGAGNSPASPIEREPVASESVPGPSDSTAAARIPTEHDAAGNVRKHVMKKDETYTSIAKLLYGDGRHYLAIQRANPDLDPERIRPGTVINLPDPAAIKGADSGSGAEPAGPNGTGGASGAAGPRAIDPKTEYEVKPDDSLHRIATRVYGTSAMWKKIYELNQQAIGSDPEKLKLGMVLKLPPNPSEAQGSDASKSAGDSTESASR